MKKLFISQPMNGKSNEEIEKERNNAIEEAKRILGNDVEVIDSFFKDVPVDAKPLWFLSKSLELLSDADAVYFVDGWEHMRGCRIEHDCAMRYGYNIIHD